MIVPPAWLEGLTTAPSAALYPAEVPSGPVRLLLPQAASARAAATPPAASGIALPRFIEDFPHARSGRLKLNVGGRSVCGAA
jgi:hypothetical protein